MINLIQKVMRRIIILGLTIGIPIGEIIVIDLTSIRGKCKSHIPIQAIEVIIVISSRVITEIRIIKTIRKLKLKLNTSKVRH